MSEPQEDFPTAMADSISVQSCLEHKTITICAHKGNGGLVCQMNWQDALGLVEVIKAEQEKILDQYVKEVAAAGKEGGNNE